MKVLFLLILVLYQGLMTTGHEKTYTSLRFGKDNTSYILIEEDMSPLKKEISICSWIKRMRDDWDDTQIWLSYGVSASAYEIVFSDMGLTLFLNHRTQYTEPTRTTGEWHSMCLTWSFTTRTKNVYYDGQQIGTEGTRGRRTLIVPGTLLPGQLLEYDGVENIENGYYFGGELFDTNIFSTQLSAGQVKEMFTRGRCGNYSQTFAEDIFLSWRDILRKERTGNVTEVQLEECDTDHTHPEEEEEREDRSDKNSGTWDFLRETTLYNKIISEELLKDMKTRLNLIREFRNHTIDDPLIRHFEKHHSDRKPGNDETDETADSQNLPDTDNWNFLRHKTYYESLITDVLISEMKRRLKLLKEFITHRCDDPLIAHLNKHHSD